MPPFGGLCAPFLPVAGRVIGGREMQCSQVRRPEVGFTPKDSVPSATDGPCRAGRVKGGAVYGTGTERGGASALVLRLDTDNKIVELRDVPQVVPDSYSNDNGMF